MNVFAILPFDDWISSQVIPGLTKASDRLRLFQYRGMACWDDPTWVKERLQEGQRLVESIQKAQDACPIDLLLFMIYDDFLLPQTATIIRRMGIPMVNYHVDMPTQWYRILRTAKLFDLVAVSHTDYWDNISKLTETMYVPMAANPEMLPPGPIQKEFDVLFVGGHTPVREDILSAVSQITLNTVVYGGNWSRTAEEQRRVGRAVNFVKLANDLRYYSIPRLRTEGLSRMLKTRSVAGRTNTVPFLGRLEGYLAPDEFAATISKARIVLGINQRFGSLRDERGYVCGRLRDFEIPACGAFYLAQRYRELSVYYAEGEEIEGWSTIDELCSKIRLYLSDTARREAIAARGRDRVLRCHTWESRFRSIYNRVCWRTANAKPRVA